MSDRIITRVIEILETDPNFYVPVKKLWLTCQGERLGLNLELDDFHQILIDDERFEFTPGMEHQAEFENDPEFAKEMEREMEALGFYSGPRVKLTSREMTAEDVFAAMSRSLTRMNQALQGAWETRPEDDQETEDQLLDILAAGQKLERQVREIIDQERGQEQDEISKHST
ncbi:MAG: hypothetical protein SWK90_08665 [Chloroflexota bacterium]|nr:hypothetical protein [Chloroflexota bacterium]